MSDAKTYNGWANYATWCLNLWIDNEEGSYRYWRNQVRHIWRHARAEQPFTRREKATYTLEDTLKDEFTEAMPELQGFWQDLLSSALDDVNWREIAESMLEDTIDGAELLEEEEEEGESDDVQD